MMATAKNKDQTETIVPGLPTLDAPTEEPKTKAEKKALIEADDEVRRTTDGVDWDAYPRKYLN